MQLDFVAVVYPIYVKGRGAKSTFVTTKGDAAGELVSSILFDEDSGYVELAVGAREVIVPLSMVKHMRRAKTKASKAAA